VGAQRTISGTQFTLLLVASYVTAGIFSFPSAVVEHAGAAGLLAVLLTTAVAFAFAVLTVWVGRHFPGTTAVQWGDVIVPFRLHRVLAGLGAAFHLVMPPTIIRTFAELLKETYFQNTPAWALVLPLVLVAGYGALLGVEAIGRVTVLTLPLMLVTVTIAYALTSPMWELYRLRMDVSNPAGLLQGAWFAALLYEGSAAMMMLQSRLERPERAVRYVCWSFAITTVLFVLIYMATVASLGLRGVEIMALPAPQLLLLVRIRGWFTERLGLFVEIVWAGLLVLSAAIHLWAVALAGVQVFGWKQARAIPWLIGVEMAVYYAVAMLPQNIEQVKFLFRWLVWGFVYLNMALPLLWLVVGLLRGSFRKPRQPVQRTPY
jgi:hypothetical protein